MNIKYLYNLLLYNIEFALEENKLLDYVFGIRYPEISARIDDSIIKIIAYKKMLHCLETVKYQINDHNVLLDEYLGRIEVLKLKIEKRLSLELLEKGSMIQNINENICSNLESEINKDEFLENKSNNFAVCNYFEESTSISRNKTGETNHYDGFDKNVINDRMKDELLELAYEMKSSALKFQELFRKEEKVSFFFFFRVNLTKI